GPAALGQSRDPCIGAVGSRAASFRPGARLRLEVALRRRKLVRCLATTQAPRLVKRLTPCVDVSRRLAPTRQWAERAEAQPTQVRLARRLAPGVSRAVSRIASRNHRARVHAACNP